MQTNEIRNNVPILYHWKSKLNTALSNLDITNPDNADSPNTIKPIIKQSTELAIIFLPILIPPYQY